MKTLARFFIRLLKFIPFLLDRILSPIYKGAMKHCGQHVRMRPLSSDFKGLENLSIGDGTSLPKNTVIYCTEAPVTIGRNVIFGPRPTIISGDHRTDIPGRFIIDCTEKLPSNDQPVQIEDDVWIGANVTILKGVTIGKGSVIAAGSVVTKSIPPCCIAGGIPARVLKNRFQTDEDVETHLRFLGKNQEAVNSR